MTAQRPPSEYAGKTVKIRDTVLKIGGSEFRVEDWWINVAGMSWTVARGNPAALNYGARSGLFGLPLDDEVLYGKIGHFGYLVHVSEVAADA